MVPGTALALWTYWRVALKRYCNGGSRTKSRTDRRNIYLKGSLAKCRDFSSVSLGVIKLRRKDRWAEIGVKRAAAAPSNVREGRARFRLAAFACANDDVTNSDNCQGKYRAIQVKHTVIGKRKLIRKLLRQNCVGGLFSTRRYRDKLSGTRIFISLLYCGIRLSQSYCLTLWSPHRLGLCSTSPVAHETIFISSGEAKGGRGIGRETLLFLEITLCYWMQIKRVHDTKLTHVNHCKTEVCRSKPVRGFSRRFRSPKSMRSRKRVSFVSRECFWTAQKRVYPRFSCLIWVGRTCCLPAVPQ